MKIERIVVENGELVELRVGDDGLFTNAHVPLESLAKSERQWLTKLALAAQSGDVRSRALLLEAVQGALIIDDDASAMKKRKGDSPA